MKAGAYPSEDEALAEFLGTPTPKGGLPSMSSVPAITGTAIDNKVAQAIRDTLLSRNMGGAARPVTPEAPKEPVITKVEHKLGAGQKMASAVLGIKLKKEEDFPVTVLDKAKLSPQVSGLVPSVDPDYKVQKEEALKLLRGWEDGDKTLMTGPTGSGKSSLIRYCAALTGRPFIRVNMTGDTESSVLFGGLVVRGGATVWEDGPVTEAVRYGAVLLIDEWELMTPEISMGMQWLLEDDGKLYLKEMPGTSLDKLITPHEHFRIVCGGNTVGQGDDTGSHAGTNVQNTATVDRFQTTIVLSYLNATHEVGILKKKHPKLDVTIIENMVKVAALVRQANQQGNIALTMSPRTLINWGRKIMTWGDVKVAFTIAFLDKLRDADRKVVSELFNKVFGR
jgi:cobaltochelatase CobS